MKTKNYYNNKQILVSIWRYTKRVHLVSVLHFLFLVSNYIMECGLSRSKLSRKGAKLEPASLRRRTRAECFVDPKWRQFRSVLTRYPPIAPQPISMLVPFPKRFRPERPHIEVKAARETLEWVGGEDLTETKYDLSMFYIHPSKPTVVRMESLWFLVRVEDEIASL